MTERRWYNCWLAHSWGQWEPRRIQVRDYFANLAGSPYQYGEWRDVEGQKQTCSICGK